MEIRNYQREREEELDGLRGFERLGEVIEELNRKWGIQKWDFVGIFCLGVATNGVSIGIFLGVPAGFSNWKESCNSKR